MSITHRSSQEAMVTLEELQITAALVGESATDQVEARNSTDLAFYGGPERTKVVVERKPKGVPFGVCHKPIRRHNKLVENVGLNLWTSFKMLCGKTLSLHITLNTSCP
ncbi:hypothetical protein ILYODFUR_006479 [Ilyodon furcidens]|uniref:Uncharacterized protein n=1 Tax=Ilyodon furcidens TaxID=33524 RepID=A0ABV0U3L1_9TELE